MNSLSRCVFAVLVTAAFAVAARPTTTTAPANPLIGRWQVVSIGPKKVPANLKVVWTFDGQQRVVTSFVDNQADLTTTTEYRVRQGGPHNVITLKSADVTLPDHVGWYEFKDGKLRVQLSIETGQPPERWDEANVMLFERLPPEK